MFKKTFRKRRRLGGRALRFEVLVFKKNSPKTLKTRHCYPPISTFFSHPSPSRPSLPLCHLKLWFFVECECCLTNSSDLKMNNTCPFLGVFWIRLKNLFLRETFWENKRWKNTETKTLLFVPILTVLENHEFEQENAYKQQIFKNLTESQKTSAASKKDNVVRKKKKKGQEEGRRGSWRAPRVQYFGLRLLQKLKTQDSKARRYPTPPPPSSLSPSHLTFFNFFETENVWKCFWLSHKEANTSFLIFLFDLISISIQKIIDVLLFTFGS